MVNTIEKSSADLYAWASDDAEIILLEKEQTGRTTIEDISDALDEYKRLWRAGIASKAETMTLARAFPDAPEYTEASVDLDPLVVGGPASVELIDREGHMITTDALQRAFKRYMANFRTRNAMVLHSDVQVGWALPAYINKSGQIFKSGVDSKGLYFICEIRDDTKIANRVKDQINEGKLKSYSIAGSATKTQNMQKGLMPYMQVDEMELAEVTVCEKGVNQGAGFDLLKSLATPEGSCIDGSCLIKLEKKDDQISPQEAGLRNATEPEISAGISCASCQYFVKGGYCELVAGSIDDDDWCKLYSPNTASEGGDPTAEGSQPTLEVILMEKENGDIDFIKSFNKWQEVQKSDDDCPCNIFGHDTIETFTDIISKAGKDPKDPLEDGKPFTTLHNYEGRDAEHHQLLREYGFPSEQPLEGMRYTPVVEVETNDWGMPINHKPPWGVNEAGESLGNRLDEDSPDYSTSPAAKAKEAAEDAGHPWYSPEIEITITKQFLNYMEGVNGVEVPIDLQQQPYTQPYDGDKGLPITSWIKQTTQKEGVDADEQEVQKAETNPFAVATAQAKKQGYTDFSEDSKGDKQRKDIAEALKRK